MYQRMEPVVIRLPKAVRARIDELAMHVGMNQADVYRMLLDEGLAARARPAATPSLGTPDQELDLHVLIAVEQVIALMESFLPRGQGAARRVLPEAVLAAQRRLELKEGVEA